MKSKGGKIFYRCERCNSSDIFKYLGFPPFTKGNFFQCNTCQTWGNWRDRKKQSVLEYFNSIRPLVYMRKGNNVAIESKGVLHIMNRVRIHPGMLYEINYPVTFSDYNYSKCKITIAGKEYEIHGRLK